DRRPRARGGKEAAPMLKVVGTEAAQDGVDGRSLLDEITREGARRMSVAALGAEVAAYLEAHRDERGDDGHALVVRNGKGRTRKMTVGAGTIAVSAPRVAVSRRSALDCRARRDPRPDRAPGPALKPNARGEPPALAAITGQRVPQLDRPVAYSGIAPPANRAPGSRATGVPS